MVRVGTVKYCSTLMGVGGQGESADATVYVTYRMPAASATCSDTPSPVKKVRTTRTQYTYRGTHALVNDTTFCQECRT
jgi:hypothetical protein